MEPDLRTEAAAGAVFDYVLETAPVLALYLDDQQRIVVANAHARRVLGDIVGRCMPEIVLNFGAAIDWSDLIAEGGRRLLSLNTQSGMPESFFFHFLPDPRGTWALGSWDVQEQQRLRNEVLELNRDLNELSRQLHQANAELLELNQLKNQFLGMAAHDLRRPIGVVMMYSEFVLDEAGARLTHEHREFLQICLDAAVSMKQLIDSFLDVAVIESGRLQLDLTPASVEDITAPALAIARVAASRKGVILLPEIPADDRRLLVDAPKMQQVLLNLIGNAVEHSLPGKRVWLSARWEAAQLVFAVRDEGPGIPADAQRRLFAPFERAGVRKTANERSTGLGLAIARKIVEAHRGRIWVDSSPGCGATFSVALPA